jgi:hypothetical protein
LSLAGVSSSEALAIEDSLNGMKSALAAGLPTIQFEQNPTETPSDGNLPVIARGNWSEIQEFLVASIQASR